MKLSVDYGSHGFSEEYDSVSEIIKMLIGHVDEAVTEIIVKKTAGNQRPTVNYITINISGNSGEQGTAPSGHAGSRSGWHGKFYTNNPVEMAYRILLLLEEAKVPRMCVDSILEALKSILDFQEVVITPRNMENPNFPK